MGTYESKRIGVINQGGAKSWRKFSFYYHSNLLTSPKQNCYKKKGDFLLLSQSHQIKPGFTGMTASKGHRLRCVTV